MSEYWTDDAVCLGSRLDFFGIDEEGKIAQSLYDQLVLTCSRCPVSRDCATFAMRSGDVERFGIWAGSVPRRRLQLRALPVAEAVDKLMSDLEKARIQAVLRCQGRSYRRTEFITADIKHGLYGYNNRGCRCEVCEPAGTEYTAKQRERQRQQRRKTVAV